MLSKLDKEEWNLVNVPDAGGDGLLHLAVKRGSLWIVKEILKWHHTQGTLTRELLDVENNVG